MSPVPRAKRGFALLITITLLAFLVVLLVSLASLTRVETQVAGNSQQLAQARQNALMALNIALGQLQKYAGPDQRVTATADLAGGALGARLSAGGTATNDSSINSVPNGLVAAQPGTRYWTGVWGNSSPSSPTQDGNIYVNTPNPVLLNWLVSGNENTAAPAFGQATAGAPSILPSMTVKDFTDGITTPSATTVYTITRGGTTETSSAVVLVGAKAAGTTTRTLVPAKQATATDPASPAVTENASDRYVVSPLMTITVPAKNISGMDQNNTSSTTIGRYAYWVGDEGVKARINLTDPYSDKSVTTTQQEARYRLMTAPRTGMEAISDFSTSSYSAHSQATVLSANTAARIATNQQASFLDSNITVDNIAQRFHDFTTSSIGIAADSYNGGLRHDLTYEFEKTALGTWDGPDNQSAGAGTGILPTAYSPQMLTLTASDKRVPRWDILHSFYNLPTAAQTSLTGSSTDYIEVRPATDTQMGILPVIVKMRLMLGAAANATATASTAITPNLPAKTYRMLVSPLVVLANPYTVTLKASSGINLKFYHDTRIRSNNLFLFGSSTYKSQIFGGGGPLDGTILKIPAFILAPGQAAVFYISGAKAVTSAGTSVTMTQMNGSPPNANGFSDYLYHDYGNFTQSSGGIQFRAWETFNNSNFTVEFSLGTPGSSQMLQMLGGINPNRSSGAYPSRNLVTNDATKCANEAICLYEWRYTTPADNITPIYGASAVPGVVHTTARGLADFNPRAGYYRVTNINIGSPPYVQFFGSSTGSTLAVLGEFKANLSTPYWGRATTPNNNNSIATALLFDVPRQSSGIRLGSLGALQHANMAAEDIPASGADFAKKFGTPTNATYLSPNPGHQPAYILGNSYASVLVTRNAAKESRTDRWVNGGVADVDTSNTYYDMSYLLNAAVWDGYFFSTIPQSGSTTPANPRYSLIDSSSSDLRSGTKAAAHISINGAFNINSTSVDAWTAFLGGMKNLPPIPGLPSSSSSTNNTAAVYPRSLWQTTAALATPTGTESDAYSGYRQLSDTDIQNLAAQIVKQVRLRGPFVSLGHFINRALISAAADTTNGLGQAGALQKAIDKAELNVTDTPGKGFSGLTAAADKASIPFVDDSSAVSDMGGRGANSTYSDNTVATLNAGVPTQLQRSTCIPGWLTQADVLQAIGPVISARSDTFVIRTYGDTINPVISTTTPVARAWCEAVVQRMPDYVESSMLAETNLTTAPSSDARTTNKTFGRRFKIVSFRWLGVDDI